MEDIRKIADDNNLVIHLDGARILNTCAATGVSPAEYTKHVDSVNMCLSKGLGCPAGSVLSGSAEFIAK